MRLWRTELFALVDKSLLNWEKRKKKKTHNIASVYNFRPQKQIDLKSLFQIIQMKKTGKE